MDFMALYTKTDGRISRKTWWIGSIILAVVLVIVQWLLIMVFTGDALKNLVNAASDPTMAANLANSLAQTTAWISLVVLIVFGYPIYCLGIKRRHDKNNNGYDLIGYVALWALVYIVQGLLGAGVVSTLLSFVALVYAIYMLIVLGFLKGTTGTNQYGPDPLAGTVAAAA